MREDLRKILDKAWQEAFEAGARRMRSRAAMTVWDLTNGQAHNGAPDGSEIIQAVRALPLVYDPD